MDHLDCGMKALFFMGKIKYTCCDILFVKNAEMVYLKAHSLNFENAKMNRPFGKLSY